MAAEGAAAPTPYWTSLIRDVADFPSPGIVFRDISPLLAKPDAFAEVVRLLADAGRDENGRTAVSKVAGVESRGFILAAPVALALHAGLVLVRKEGKLPRDTYSESYALEYGAGTLQIQTDAVARGDQVLVIDDVFATGGTIGATVALVARAGASVVAAAVLIELAALHGRQSLPGLRLVSLTTL